MGKNEKLQINKASPENAGTNTLNFSYHLCKLKQQPPR
jgi:hypothetical protein